MIASLRTPNYFRAHMSLPTFPPLVPALALAAFATIAAAQDDPQARAALPEFQIIPAAKPEELTSAATIDPKQFEGWTRSLADAHTGG